MDIEKIENTMKSLVMQQLGDKTNYDSSLGDLDQLTGPEAVGEKPLEKLIKDALDYDSVCYNQALGIDLQTANGVKRSQEFSKLRKSQVVK